jgi:hypothetical protein
VACLPFKDHHTKPQRGGRSIEKRIETIHQAPEGRHSETHPLWVMSFFFPMRYASQVYRNIEKEEIFDPGGVVGL